MSAAAAKVQDLLARNAKYASTYKKPVPLAAMRQKARAMNVRAVVILSCSDPRVVPADYFDLAPGEFAIIRNAGGRAADAVRSLVVLDTIVPIGTVMVIHHTDCGAIHICDDEIRRAVTARRPEMADEIKGMSFGEIADMEGSVREDIELLKSSRLLPADMEVLGFVLDLEMGLLKEVKP